MKEVIILLASVGLVFILSLVFYLMGGGSGLVCGLMTIAIGFLYILVIQAEKKT